MGPQRMLEVVGGVGEKITHGCKQRRKERREEKVIKECSKFRIR